MLPAIEACPYTAFCTALRAILAHAMYEQFFRLTQTPFSIAPDPRYLFMSERHREALAHLLYGVNSGGGLVLLTGDIGTGKTTICRCFLEQAPANCNLAYIFNPKLTVGELLQTICEEFHIELPQQGQHPTGAKDCIDALNRYLLASHAEGRNNVLVIDEAQNLSADVLEQLRLLTNLETSERKLLQIILIGQPELRTMLLRPELEQLAQRVIAHYHLTALSEQETASYIQHRLATAGLTTASPFQQTLMKQIHQITRGVPRRINLLCDRAMLGAYAKGVHEVDRTIVDNAAGELFINRNAAQHANRKHWKYMVPGLIVGFMVAGAAAWALNEGELKKTLRERWPEFEFWSSPGLMKSQALASTEGKIDASHKRAHPSDTNETEPAAATASSIPILQEQDGVAHARLRNEKEAMRQLAQMWGVSLQDGDACEAARSAGLRCHKGSGGFAELGQLARPAVLTLYDRAGKPYYALLAALDEAQVLLRAGNDSQTVSRAALARHFRGELITLWRTPPGFGEAVQLGDKGPAVDWIAAQLARINETQPPAPGQPFDPQTLKQVRQLQQAHGLFVDGVVGPATVMQLNRVAGVQEPDLRRYPTSGE